MPPRRGRPKKGDRRIDAAIDHFVAMGYAARDVQAIVHHLLKLYGSADAWPLLEEGSYQLVLDLLIEKQQEEEKQQLLPEHGPQAEEQQVEAVGQEPPQNQRLAEDEAPPENSMEMSEVHNEVSAEPESPDEGVEDPVFGELPAHEVAVPLPTAIGNGGTRCPCYGWISESDDEEEITCRQPEVHIQSVEGGSLYKRKRPE